MNVGKIAYEACRVRKLEDLGQKPEDALYTRSGYWKNSQQSQLTWTSWWCKKKKKGQSWNYEEGDFSRSGERGRKVR